ncbi:MAG: TonB-dependent siderophore receptor [Bryobacteraceae bacterium]
MMQFGCKRQLGLASLAILFSGAAMAQQGFCGRVEDATGAALAGASVTAMSRTATVSTPAPATASGPDGNFCLPLPTGRYSVTIAAEGFEENVEEVEVASEAQASRTFVLKVANRKEFITVTETPGYRVEMIGSALKMATELRDTPQSISIVSREQIRDQMMLSIGDVVRYTPGITAVQGEGNRDQIVIRGNSSTSDFFINGMRDDVQYYRDLYNLERVEALKGPNAMAFGRGGGGGVINRVTKEAGWMPLREITLNGGSFNSKRVASDWNFALHRKAALRLNGMYENSGTFRNFVDLERYGITPTATFLLTEKTKIVTTFEYFKDGRVSDRGIPSFQGRPLNIPITTFYGNPADANARAAVYLGSVRVEHQFGRVNLRNNTMIGDYDRGYQNYVPGAVTADQSQSALSGYNNATQRRNVFNQTDLSASIRTGRIEHNLVGGTEFGRQSSYNFRNTAYFNNTATSILVLNSNPLTSLPVTFRQSATDANNHVAVNVAATYLQDQMKITRYLHVVAGVRFDRFALDYLNRRDGQKLQRTDNLISPRVGVVIKPSATVSIYGNYSVTFLPSSGDQFASLTTVTQQVKPERFNNYEAGVKWDFARNLALTAAVYRLDRTNTRSTDPNDPTRIIQTGSQRTNGVELGWAGSVTRKWRVAGGYSYQDAFISSATAAATLGAQVAQVPHHTFSAWNNYQFLRRWSGGIGIIHRSDMFAGVDNAVVLPGYTRVDGALYYSLNEKIRVQVNAENLGGIQYYLNANGNNNISPGSSRAIRVGITTRF